jgi:hypothetical protein
MSWERRTSSLSHTWGEVGTHSQSGAVLMSVGFLAPKYLSKWMVSWRQIPEDLSPLSAWGFTSVAPISTNGCSPDTNCPLTDRETDS